MRDYGRKMVVYLYEREDRQQVRSALPKASAAKKIPALRNLLDDLDGMDERLHAMAFTLTNPNR